MNKKKLASFLLLSFLATNAQVGIGTVDPKATLEVNGNPNVASIPDGVIAPRISRAELIAKTSYTIAQTAAIVYVTDLTGVTNAATTQVNSIGYYYFDGTVWNYMNASQSQFSFGDIKSSYKTTDHNGWIKQDGRAISTLTTTLKTRALALGFTTNLPNANNAYISQNGQPLGSVTGNNSKNILRSNLPNVNLTGATSISGIHEHTYSDRGIGAYSLDVGVGLNNVEDNGVTTKTTSADGAHFHTISLPLNGGLPQVSFDVSPRTLSVNSFIYLGED